MLSLHRVEHGPCMQWWFISQKQWSCFVRWSAVGVTLFERGHCSKWKRNNMLLFTSYVFVSQNSTAVLFPTQKLEKEGGKKLVWVGSVTAVLFLFLHVRSKLLETSLYWNKILTGWVALIHLVHWRTPPLFFSLLRVFIWVVLVVF